MISPAPSLDRASLVGGVLARRTTNATRTLGFAGAAFFVGQAITLANGAYSSEAIKYITFAWTAALLGVLLPPPPVQSWQIRRVLVIVMAAGLAVQFGDLLVAPPGIYLRPNGSPLTATFQRGLAVAAVAIGVAVAERRRISWLALATLISAHFVIGSWMIRSSPEPHIDVYYFQRDSSQALLHGVNPYAITFPNIYGDSTPFYGPGMSVGGRLQFGFPYPPLSLFFATLGHLASDCRYAQLVAMDVAALLMGTMSGAGVGVLAAAIYLFTPRNFFVLEQGWTEPYAVLLVALVAFCALRHSRLLPYVVGVLFAVKQYMILAIGPTLLLAFALNHRLGSEAGASQRSATTSNRIVGVVRFFGIAFAVTTILTLPLALWNWRSFFHSVVALQFFQPFRDDALSYLVSVAQSGGPQLPSSIAFMAAFLTTGFCLWRLPRSAEGFAGAMALVFFAFFAFNKQAFANYYFLVIGAFCCAVAAAPALKSEEDGVGSSPHR